MKRRSGSNTPIMLALLAVVVFSLGYYLSIQKEGLGGGPGPFKPRPKKRIIFMVPVKIMILLKNIMW